MSLDRMLPLLEKVKHTEQGRWLARCPAHDDRSPSLAVRELDDGRVLLHCFAGCSVQEIVSSVGLELSDLFPQNEIPREQVNRNGDPFLLLTYFAVLPSKRWWWLRQRQNV
jgi:hypothetical protein